MSPLHRNNNLPPYLRLGSKAAGRLLLEGIIRVKLDNEELVVDWLVVRWIPSQQYAR